MLYTDIPKFNAKNLEKTLGNESERKEKEGICLGYSIRHKIVCEKCQNPHNKYCPFYIPPLKINPSSQ